MRDGRTSAPRRLSESELIALMACTRSIHILFHNSLVSRQDKNGIGTDATIAEHIQKIQERVRPCF